MGMVTWLEFGIHPIPNRFRFSFFGNFQWGHLIQIWIGFGFD